MIMAIFCLSGTCIWKAKEMVVVHSKQLVENNISVQILISFRRLFCLPTIWWGDDIGLVDTADMQLVTAFCESRMAHSG